MYQDPRISKFYLNGYTRFSQEGREFATVAAIYSRVVEAFQGELMEDSRVCLIYPQLWRTIAEELRWVVDLEQPVWESLAAVAQIHWMTLRDSTTHAAHISFHFMWRRVLEPASQLPWKLARGDPMTNLRNMADGDCPEEPMSKSLWVLWHDKTIKKEQLVQVVKLLSEVGWTSLPCEQQHGSLAQLKRYHPDYSVNTLISRGLMHQTARLLPKASAEEKRITAISQRIAKLAKSNPNKIGGSQMLVKAMVAIAKGKKEMLVVLIYNSKLIYRYDTVWY